MTERSRETDKLILCFGGVHISEGHKGLWLFLEAENIRLERRSIGTILSHVYVVPLITALNIDQYGGTS